MSIFDILPHLEACCYCISLKTGSIIIAVVHLLIVIEAVVGGGASSTFSKCYSQGLLMKILGYVAIAVALAILATAIFFIYGVITLEPSAVVWFMYASLALLIYNIVVSVVLFLEPTKKECSPPYILGGATLFSSLMLCYCLVVLASYHRIMMFQ